MASILIVSYRFPPCGGPGVQRNLKYAKYFPCFDWVPHVLTVKGVSYYVYDPALLNELGDGVEIVRTGSLDPARLSYMFLSLAGRAPDERVRASSSDSSDSAGRASFISDNSRVIKLYRFIRDAAMFPDGSAGWLPFAIWRGVAQVLKHDIRIILGAYPDPSNAVAAYAISKITGRPYILDFRDGWVDYPYRNDVSRFHLWAHKRLEKLVVGNASHVVVYGDYLGDRLKSRYGIDNISNIPNGFDSDDFEAVVPHDYGNDRYNVAHVGNLLSYRKEVFGAFLDSLVRTSVEVRSRVLFSFIGNSFDGAQEQIDARGLTNSVALVGYMPHSEALRYLAGANAGLIILPAGDKAAVTGKVFEYMAAGLPILSISEPEGALAKMIVPMGHVVAHPLDGEAVGVAITQLVQGRVVPDAQSIGKYSRKENTRKLAVIARGCLTNTAEYDR